jgi:hypothetical protein
MPLRSELPKCRQCPVVLQSDTWTATYVVRTGKGPTLLESPLRAEFDETAKM